MSEYKPVQVDAAKQIAVHFEKSIVVVVAYDPVHGLIHTTSYGVLPADKLAAAKLAELLNATAGGDLSRATSYEDFRTVDAAKSRREIEVLTEKLNQIRERAQNGLRDNLFISPKGLLSILDGDSTTTGGPDHGS